MFKWHLNRSNSKPVQIPKRSAYGSWITWLPELKIEIFKSSLKPLANTLSTPVPGFGWAIQVLCIGCLYCDYFYRKGEYLFDELQAGQFCFLGNFLRFFVDWFDFFKIRKNLSGIPLVSNRMDPDQAQYSVGPDLGPNCLQKWSADDNSL